MGSLSCFIFATSLVGGLTGCIGSQVPKEIQKPMATAEPLSGNFVTSQGEVLNFAQYDNRPLVVMFAQLTCLVCQKEARGLLLNLPNQKIEPTKAKFITVLVRADNEDAAEWKSRTGVPWTVGAVDNNRILAPYCPDLLTPCTVVQFPGKRIVFVKSGEVEPLEIRNILGTLD